MAPNIDPVCGMKVADDTPHHVEHEGQHFRFCSRHCLDKFQANPAAYIKPKVPAPAVHVPVVAVTYACPMHPEVVRSEPGDCPICGMALEARNNTAMPDRLETQHLSRGRRVFYGFLAVAGFFLFTEHRAHALGILPYLLLLACPLMHLFMHHGHGGHGRH